MDDDTAFVEPLEEQGLVRGGCLFHVRRAVGRALGRLRRQERERWAGVIGL